MATTIKRTTLDEVLETVGRVYQWPKLGRTYLDGDGPVEILHRDGWVITFAEPVWKSGGVVAYYSFDI